MSPNNNEILFLDTVKIDRIYAVTQNWGNAGTDSPLSMQICSRSNVCCDTGTMDDPKTGDFDRNHKKTYKGHLIGGCYRFPMINVKSVTVTLHGGDVWSPKRIKVYLKDKNHWRKEVTWECDITRYHVFHGNSATKLTNCKDIWA